MNCATFKWHVTALALSSLALFPVSSAGQSPVITSAPTLVPAGPDYATDVLANPWDFSDTADLSPFPDELAGWTSSPAGRTAGRSAFLSAGRFLGRTTPNGQNTVPLLFRGGVGITSSTESSGVFDHKAIPTARYGKLAVAMTLSASTAGQLAAFWFATPYNAAQQFASGVGFRTPQAGTHIYLVDLVTGIWTDARGNPVGPSFFPILGPIAWNGTPLMRGLQLRPTSDGNAQVDVQIDWVRVTHRDGFPAGPMLPITFAGCAGRDYNVEVMPSAGVWEVIHTGRAGSATTTTANVNHGVLAPGTWSFRVTCFPTSRAPNGGTPVASQPVAITINNPPIVVVHNPDAAGGADHATTVLGNPWDWDSVTDAAQYFGVTSPSIVSDGVTNAFQATATSAGDPSVVMVYNRPIDTTRFRNLTFALTLDTPFALAPPGGSVARVFWERVVGATSALSVSKDILVWPGRNVYTIDLSTLTAANGGLESQCGCSNIPWSAAPVRFFRIDPHESTLGVRFRLGHVWLTAPDEVAINSQFAVQYAFADSDTSGSSYQARIYLDTDRDGASRALIDTVTSGVVPNTLLTYALNPAGRGVPTGEFYIFIEIAESRAGFSDARGTYSTGPLRVSSSAGPLPPGPPSLVPVQTGTNPVTIAWSAGPGGAPTNFTLVVGSSPGASNLGAYNVGTTTQITANAPPGVPIYVRVVASNAVGSAVSNEISFIVGAVLPPGRPTLAPASVSSRTVALSWAPTAGGAPAYYVLLARLPGNPTVIAYFPTVQTSAVFHNVPTGTYIVSVSAVNGGGTSPESAPIVVTVQ